MENRQQSRSITNVTSFYYPVCCQRFKLISEDIDWSSSDEDNTNEE